MKRKILQDIVDFLIFVFLLQNQTGLATNKGIANIFKDIANYCLKIILLNNMILCNINIYISKILQI
jgi:hypothetical protein